MANPAQRPDDTAKPREDRQVSRGPVGSKRKLTAGSVAEWMNGPATHRLSGSVAAGPVAQWLTDRGLRGSLGTTEVVGSRAGAVAGPGGRSRSRWCRTVSRGLFFFVSVAKVLRFQPPPVEPCVRFSRTRLTDVVHRQHSTFAARP